MNKYPLLLLCSLFMALSSCQTAKFNPLSLSIEEKNQDYYIMFLVDAPGLNYDDTKQLIKNLNKNPRTLNKEGYIGHAWLYLHGYLNNREIYLEGGHSGERGLYYPSYFEALSDLSQRKQVCFTATADLYDNPIKYLWKDLEDGFFQQGSGDHLPTYAIKIPLSPETFTSVYDFITQDQYNFKRYSLATHQCCHFIAQVAALCDFYPQYEISLALSPSLSLGNWQFRLWKDSSMQKVILATPDILEKSFKEAVYQKKAIPALGAYKKLSTTHYKQLWIKKKSQQILSFPWKIKRLVFQWML